MIHGISKPKRWTHYLSDFIPFWSVTGTHRAIWLFPLFRSVKDMEGMVTTALCLNLSVAHRGWSDAQGAAKVLGCKCERPEFPFPVLINLTVRLDHETCFLSACRYPERLSHPGCTGPTVIGALYEWVALYSWLRYCLFREGLRRSLLCSLCLYVVHSVSRSQLLIYWKFWL